MIYSRWEYSDKPLWRLQKLWTTNQDGTGTAHFWGNQSVWPDHLSEPRPIPGSRRVMFSGVAHHDWWSGSIGIIDPEKGRDFPHGLTKVTADLRWPEVSPPPEDPKEAADYHASGRFTGYKTAYPLSEEDFLVSARGRGRQVPPVPDGRARQPRPDLRGPVTTSGTPCPSSRGRVPPSQPDRVAWPGTGKDRKPVEPGVFFSADVCQGVPDLPRGTVKYLRVFQLDYKTYSTWNKTLPPLRPGRVDRAGGGREADPLRGAGRGRRLGVLQGPGRTLAVLPAPGRRPPLPADDAEFHRADARRAAGLRRLPRDAQHGAAAAGRAGHAAPARPSFRRRPGAREHQLRAVRPAGAGPLLREVPPGQGAGRRPSRTSHLRPGHNVFKEPYLTLVGPAGWGNPVGGGGPATASPAPFPWRAAYGQNDPAALATLRPMQYLSPASRLVELASSGKHYDVKADPLSLRRLIAWVDACCPFMGEEELRALGDPSFPGIERLPIRPRVATAPVVERP